MQKLTVFIIFISLSIKATADETTSRVIDIEGATIAEIAERATSGMTTFYELFTLGMAVVGVVLFASSIMLLMKINRNEAPNLKPVHAVLGMVFSAALGSVGYWLFTLTRSLEVGFT